MDIIAGVSGLLIGAVIAWQLAQGLAAAEMSRFRARMHEQVRHWQEETERARASAARMSEQTAAWAAGCQQGREDVLSLTRALAQHITQAGDGSTPG
jgi:predicted acylesterase/phospholipase RssA